jgi:SAM-dependent methyltransferase
VAESFVYDDVPYDTEANAETHPSSLATLARLCGLHGSAPSTSSILEIGCGNGENLIAAATYLPRARFVGFDLAESAVAAGIEAARRSSTTNVELFAADIRDICTERGRTAAAGSFDYVVAHGMYSWVPENVRQDLLTSMRDALAPNGIGFISLNVLPGWELRRALRELTRDATREISEPAEKVAEAQRLIGEIGRAGKDAAGFFGALSAAAREYADHVTRATPVEAPFSRYVFHDLLAEHNDPFSLGELCERLGRSGLRVVCETPLRVGRANQLGDVLSDARDAGLPERLAGLARDLARSGAPFLQVLVTRDDAPMPHEPSADAVADLVFWADLSRVSVDTYRTTTGAVVRPVPASALWRAARYAPGFVSVRELADRDAAISDTAGQLFLGFCEGVFTLVTEPPRCATSAERPCVAEHVRVRAASACSRGAPSAVLTNALHRAFRVPWSELAVARLLDGAHPPAAIAEAAEAAARTVAPALAGPLAGAPRRDVERHVATVIDRFARHLFLVEPA